MLEVAVLFFTDIQKYSVPAKLSTSDFVSCIVSVLTVLLNVEPCVDSNCFSFGIDLEDLAFLD